MDCRKLAWMAGGIVCLLVGCTRHEPQQFIPQQPPPPPKAPSARKPVTSPRDAAPDSTVLDAKPINCAKIGDLQAELASDPNRPAGEREVFSRQAKTAYRRALQLDPKFVPAHMGMGELCQNMGQFDEALASYRAVLQIEPHNVSAYVALAGVYERMENRPAALAVYKSALAAQPKEPALWYERGLCLGRAKDFDAALDSLRHAADLRSTFEDYNKAVGLMLARMGRPDEAMPWLLKANMPEDDARYNIARMMQHIGRDDVSKTQMALALRANPDHGPTLKMMGESGDAPPAESVRPTAYQPEELPAAAVQQATSLPTRPGETRVVVARPVMPPMPVVSDQWDERPAPPRLTSVAPFSKPATKPEPKPEPKPQRPTITIGFETNP